MSAFIRGASFWLGSIIGLFLALMGAGLWGLGVGLMFMMCGFALAWLVDLAS